MILLDYAVRLDQERAERAAAAPSMTLRRLPYGRCCDCRVRLYRPASSVGRPGANPSRCERCRKERNQLRNVANKRAQRERQAAR